MATERELYGEAAEVLRAAVVSLNTLQFEAGLASREKEQDDRLIRAEKIARQQIKALRQFRINIGYLIIGS